MFLSYTVDPLSAIYLICFGIGLVMSIGALILGGPVHDTTGGTDWGNDGGFHQDFHTPHDFQDAPGIEDSLAEARVPFFSMNTILAFLLGFGAGGFIAQQLLGNRIHLLTVFLALPMGLVFSGIVYLVLSKILIRGQSDYLKNSDFDLRGVEGTVSSSLYANHLGEVSYTFNQSVQAIPAREKENRALPKGTPVVILAVHQGVATVLPLEEFNQHI